MRLNPWKDVIIILFLTMWLLLLWSFFGKKLVYPMTIKDYSECMSSVEWVDNQRTKHIYVENFCDSSNNHKAKDNESASYYFTLKKMVIDAHWNPQSTFIECSFTLVLTDAHRHFKIDANRGYIRELLIEYLKEMPREDALRIASEGSLGHNETEMVKIVNKYIEPGIILNMWVDIFQVHEPPEEVW